MKLTLAGLVAVICLWAWRGCYNVAESTKEGCSKAHYETPQRRRRLDAAAAAFRAPAQPPSLLLWKVLASTLPSLSKLHIFNNLARGATSKPSVILFLQNELYDLVKIKIIYITISTFTSVRPYGVVRRRPSSSVPSRPVPLPIFIMFILPEAQSDCCWARRSRATYTRF